MEATYHEPVGWALLSGQHRPPCRTLFSVLELLLEQVRDRLQLLGSGDRTEREGGVTLCFPEGPEGQAVTSQRPLHMYQGLVAMIFNTYNRLLGRDNGVSPFQQDIPLLFFLSSPSLMLPGALQHSLDLQQLELGKPA